MQSLFDVLEEAKKEIQNLNDFNRVIGATEVPIPAVMKPLLNQWRQPATGEPLLYAFLRACTFLEVKGKNLPQSLWGNTAAVAPTGNGVNFYYDKKFINSLDIGTLVFVIAHEASHILRYSSDRQKKRRFTSSELWNVATDMMINRTIDKLDKIGPWKPTVDKDKWLFVPDDYTKEQEKQYGKDGLEKGMISSRVYRWLEVQPKEKPKVAPKPSPYKPKSGDVVKVKDENKYGRITGIDKDGNISVEEVDIQKEIEKARG